MPDYQKGKIYKLWSPQGTEDEVYIGSTCNDLRYRKYGHKQKSSVCQSKILFEKYDDVRIELIEDYPCNNRAELNKREGHYIRENNCLNKNIPDRTKKEWTEINKEKLTEYNREYYKNNKEKLAEHQREYYKNNKEKAREYQLNNKEKIAEKDKEYYKNNKEKIAEKDKEYYKNNKEKILKQQRERRRKKKEEALISL